MMHMWKTWLGFVAICGWLLALSVNAAPEAIRPQTPVEYPDGYRTWTHVKTALVSARHPRFASSGGFRHIYANAQGIAGYRSGAFADGAIIVVDWIKGNDENGEFSEGARRRLDVMLKDRSRFQTTGGWGFERFQGDSRTERTVKSAATECFACHSGPGTTDLVFSKFRQ